MTVILECSNQILVTSTELTGKITGDMVCIKPSMSINAVN